MERRSPRITLVHNPAAGYHDITGEQIAAMLRQAGYAPDSVSSKDPALDRALDDPGDCVVVAGGDGTVAKVAIILAGRDVPLFILPCGTANNIAMSLGITGSIQSLVTRLPIAKPRRIDLGVARGRWGEQRFVESFGVGLFATAMRNIEPMHDASHQRFATPHEEFEHAHCEMIKLLERTTSRECRIELDGIDRSGQYVLIEAMNIACIGPNLCLAPDADPGDGMLDVVLLPESDRESFCECLKRRIEGDRSPPPVSIVRATKITIDPCGSPLHIDDELHSESHEPLEPPGPIELSARGGQIRILVC